MITPFALQSQVDFIKDSEVDGSRTLLPDGDTFLSMTEVKGDATVADAIPILPCPSTDDLKHKVKITINAQNSTEAKNKLRRYKIKHDTSTAMNDTLKTKFSCADCSIPDVTPCTLSVANVDIAFSNPTQVSRGVYCSTLTIKYEAVCEGCVLDINLSQGSPSLGLVTISPNPVGQFLYLNLKLEEYKTDVQFRILDTTGKVVKSLQLKPAALSMRHQIDIFDLQDGMYFLESSQGESLKEVTQFIKMN